MINVMIAGLPGNMASLIASAVEEAEDMKLMPFALATREGEWQFGVGSIELIFPGRHEAMLKNLDPDVVVDFTAPDAVNRNARLYCDCEVPFVMGTTGGDRDLLKETVEHSEICAVIAPNMAKQIVVFQAMVEYAAKTFPGAFKGYRLVITESHQAAKKDTSGTAKAMAQYFNALGIPFTVDQIIMERNPLVQEVLWGVPATYLAGHGHHTYTLLSEDGTVLFQFKHNVNGRAIYVPSVLDAIRFVDKKFREKVKGEAFSMVDVLKG